jgi:hypothetical protein
MRMKSQQKNPNNPKKKTAPKLTPQQLAVIAGLLTNALEVQSIMLDRDQTIEIVLVGSIRKKTKADQIAEDLADISVADLINALMNR